MKASQSIEKKQNRAGFYFSIPALGFFTIFFLYPIINCVITSFTRWDLINPKEFVGFKNYIALFSDYDFLHAFSVTLRFTVVSFILILGISFVLALIIDREMKLSKFFKTIYFLPTIISLSVIAVLFRYMYNPYGLITLVGEALFGITLKWQSSYPLALPSVVIMVVWNRVGFYFVIFVAALQAIPSVYYDAAKIDGARYFNIVRRVIIPLMNPILLLTGILLITENFRQFVPFYLLTEGGPGDQTTPITLRIYQDGMEQFRMGKASAESLFAVIVMLVFTVFYLRIFGKETEY